MTGRRQLRSITTRRAENNHQKDVKNGKEEMSAMNL
jgi:hypothetical protein